MLFCDLIKAQIRIDGTVQDAHGHKIPFATIKWKKDTLSFANKFCIADSNGCFQLLIPNSQNGWLETSAIGYNTAYIFIENKADSITKNIILKSKGKVLENITIKSKGSVEISGDTTSYLVERFRRGNENNISDLLSNIPGFIVTQSGKLTYNGRFIDRILLNGDDISGKDYNYLLNNLDIAGIEKMQVLKNYSDNTNILSSLTNGNEQVLNIHYQKNYLHRFFGNVDAAIAHKKTRTDLGVQVLGLYTKSKTLFLQRFNSLGNRTYSLNEQSDMPAEMVVEPSYDLELFQYKPIAYIDDNSLNIKLLNNFTKNNTASTAINSLLKPFSNILIKSRLGFSYDDYYQQSNTITDFFLVRNVRIDQQNNIRKRLRNINGVTSLNYIINDRNQLILTIKGVNNFSKSIVVNTLSSLQKYNERIDYPERQFGGKLAFNKYIGRHSALAINFQYKTERFSTSYNLTPPGYKNFFPSLYSSDSLNQNEFHTFYSYIGQAKLTRRIDLNLFSISFQIQNFQSHIKNSIRLMSQGSEKKISSDSVNNSKINQLAFTTSIQYSWKFNPKLNLTIASDISFLHYSLYDLYSLSFWKKEKEIKLFPKINLQYKFSNNRQLTFSGQSLPRFIEPRYVGGGLALQNLTSLIKNTKDLQLGVGNSIQANYTHTNLLEKRQIIFSSLSYSNLPLFFLSALYPYADFTYFTLVSSNRKAGNISLLLSNQRISKDYQRKFTSNILIGFGDNYRLIQNKEEKVHFNHFQLRFNFDTDFKKMQVKSFVQYNFVQQQSNPTTTNHNVYASLSTSYKFTERIFFDTNIDYYYLKSFGQLSNSFFMLSGKLLYKSANLKWVFGLRGNNITNRASYSKAVLTATNLTTTEYQLFPRVIYAFAKYHFK